MRCSLSVGSTQVSATTHLESLLHARILSGCAVEVDLLRGDSRLIGGNAGSGLGATGRQDAYLYASDMRSLGGELTVGLVFWFVLNDGWGEDTADF